MKKIYSFLACISAVTAINGQTLTQANNAPANGDAYSTWQCDSLINPGVSGANAVWNFSTLVIHTSVIANFTTSAAVSTVYPAGSQVTASGPDDLAYTTSTSGSLKYFGGNVKAATVAASLTYTSPAISATYPMSLNTTSSAATGGSINITMPVQQSGSFTGNSSFIADGSGTLILPGGAGATFSNVLRVITAQTLSYTAGGFITGIVTFNTYNFYSPGIKAPIMTIATKTVTSNLAAPSTQSIVTVNKDYILLNTTTGIGEVNADAIVVSVYPNPATGVLNFSAPSPLVKEVLIYDITGRLVEKQNFDNGTMRLDVSGYTNGLYMYGILNSKGEVLKTGKVAVSR